MRIVAVFGSPRSNSNSTALARTVLDTAKKLGAETSEFVLHKLSYEGCRGCETCKKKLDHCVIQDDLTQVLEAVKEADAVIFASPNYFGEVSGQFKTFFDRTYSYLNPDFTGRLRSGRASVFIYSQGQPSLDLYLDVHPRYENWLKRYGFDVNHLIRMNGPRAAGSVSNRPDLVEQAEEIARKLVAGTA